MYEQNEPPSPLFAPPSPAFQVSEPPAAASPPGWPKAARITAIALCIALLAVAAVAVVLVTSSRSKADDAERELADVRGSLDSLSSDTESVEQQVDDLLTQQSDDAAEKASLQATIDEQATTLDNVNAELVAAQSATSDLQDQLAATQSDLDAAEAAAAAAAEPFTIEPKAIAPVLTDFVVPTNRVACDGFADPDSACPPTFTLDGRFLQDGDQLFMEFAEVAKVPVGSFDGFTLVGETPVTSAASFTCDGVDVPTVMRVTTSPVQVSVDPATKALTATSYTFTWTISAAAANGCTASSRTYSGTLDF
jgi:uncharacterized membrane-anchored protein YhcB (DUF1043 family)